MSWGNHMTAYYDISHCITTWANSVFRWWSQLIENDSLIPHLQRLYWFTYQIMISIIFIYPLPSLDLQILRLGPPNILNVYSLFYSVSFRLLEKYFEMLLNPQSFVSLLAASVREMFVHNNNISSVYLSGRYFQFIVVSNVIHRFATNIMVHQTEVLPSERRNSRLFWTNAASILKYYSNSVTVW